VRHVLALILSITAGQAAWARVAADLTDVASFCAAVAAGDLETLAHAEQRLDAVKLDIDAIRTLEARRHKTALDLAAAGAQVAALRLEVDALREHRAQLSLAMLWERRLIEADIRSESQELHRLQRIVFRFTRELGEIEIDLAVRRRRSDARTRAAVAIWESDLRRCVADNRERLR
jgi:hypothetical protein